MSWHKPFASNIDRKPKFQYLCFTTIFPAVLDIKGNFDSLPAYVDIKGNFNSLHA